MQNFESFKIDEAPNEAKPLLDKIESKNGFVPNIIRGIARSPQLLKSYVELENSFESSSLTPEQQHIVLLAVSRFNECEYCTSVHSQTAEKTDLEWDTIEKIRNRQKLSDERQEALRNFTELLVKHTGHVPHDARTQFENAGFDERTALDVMIGVTLKTLTNATNHLIDTPLDEQFQKRVWSAEKQKAATA